MILLLLSILCLSILNCLFVVSLFCSQRVSDLLWKSCLRLEFWLQVVQNLYRVSGMGDSAVARLTCTIAWLRSFRRNTWLLLSYEGTLRVWQWAPPLSRRWGQSRPRNRFSGHPLSEKFSETIRWNQRMHGEDAIVSPPSLHMMTPSLTPET